ncbi:hypothetical protein ACP70R_002060 [Stipagrostis hirtigluma subsp. patula]
MSSEMEMQIDATSDLAHTVHGHRDRSIDRSPNALGFILAQPTERAMIGAAFTRRQPRKQQWGRQELTFFVASPAAPGVPVQSRSPELNDDEEEEDGLSHSDADMDVGFTSVSACATDSAYSDSVSDAEQLLTSGDGNPHESRSSTYTSSSSRRLQKLSRREKLRDKLEILASAPGLLGRKNADGDHGGLRRSSASSAGTRAGFCFCTTPPASPSPGRQRGNERKPSLLDSHPSSRKSRSVIGAPLAAAAIGPAAASGWSRVAPAMRAKAAMDAEEDEACGVELAWRRPVRSCARVRLNETDRSMLRRGRGVGVGERGDETRRAACCCGGLGLSRRSRCAQ